MAFWRPVTAAIAGGGSYGLQADFAWLPLGTAPNHPEYPPAHGCITAAITTLIAGYFGSTKNQVVVESLAFQDGTHAHKFEDTRRWNRMPLPRFGGVPPARHTTGDIESMKFLAGQWVGLVRDVKPAGEIVREIVQDAARILAERARQAQTSRAATAIDARTTKNGFSRIPAHHRSMRK